MVPTKTYHLKGLPVVRGVLYIVRQTRGFFCLFYRYTQRRECFGMNNLFDFRSFPIGRRDTFI